MLHLTPRPGRSARVASRPRQRGQSLVEFSIVLPVLMAIMGVVADAARLYRGWTNLESATRDASEYLAKSDTDPTSANYTIQGVNSDNKAIYLMNSATGVTFTRSPTQGVLTDCSRPQLTTTFQASTSSSGGGSLSNPVGTARVLTCMPFRTLFAYPFLTIDGNWILRSERQMSIIVGR